MIKDVYAFAHDVDKEIDSFSKYDYLNKIGHCKKLREEILPISRLALFLKKPGLDVGVETFEDSGEIDGHISIKGFYNNELDIQVSFIFNYEDALRNELLSKKGYASGFGMIYRDKGSKGIISKMEGTSDEDKVTLLSKAIIERFSDKQNKNYKNKMLLIIAFEDLTFSGRSAWKNLFKKLDEFKIPSDVNFSFGYLINCASNEVCRWF
jgi:hypothetical protein